MLVLVLVLRVVDVPRGRVGEVVVREAGRGHASSTASGRWRESSARGVRAEEAADELHMVDRDNGALPLAGSAA